MRPCTCRQNEFSELVTLCSFTREWIYFSIFHLRILLGYVLSRLHFQFFRDMYLITDKDTAQEIYATQQLVESNLQTQGLVNDLHSKHWASVTVFATA